MCSPSAHPQSPPRPSRQFIAHICLLHAHDTYAPSRFTLVIAGFKVSASAIAVAPHGPMRLSGTKNPTHTQPHAHEPHEQQLRLPQAIRAPPRVRDLTIHRVQNAMRHSRCTFTLVVVVLNFSAAASRRAPATSIPQQPKSSVGTSAPVAMSAIASSIIDNVFWPKSILSPGQGLRTRAKRTTGKQGLRYTPRPEASRRSELLGLVVPPSAFPMPTRPVFML
jgi:hypothetical protein